MAEKIKERMVALRNELDTQKELTADLERNLKKAEHEISVRDQEIGRLQAKIAKLETDADNQDAQVKVLKSSVEEGQQSKSTAATLEQRIALLEEELDKAEKSQRETVAKLREVDVKAEHFERRCARAEQEKDTWEAKYEELDKKYKKNLDDLTNLERELGSL